MLVAFGLVGSVSAIEVNENLSIGGFIDGSYSSTDNAGTDTSDLGLDEVEIDFLFNAGGVSGEVHVDSVNSAGNNELNIEQAHLSYGFEGGLTLTVGTFGSALGLEREDPGGLYTYSRAYGDADNALNLGNVDNGAQEGVRVSYAADQFGVSISMTNAQDGDDLEEAAGENDLDVEVAFSYTGIENLAIGGGFGARNGQTSPASATSTGPVADVDYVNVHAAYTTGKLLIGGEWITADTDSVADDIDAYTVLIDYDVSDVLGVAVRYSEWGSVDGDSDRLTIAPNYSITESFGAILEYSTDNLAGVANNTDSDTLAVEFTFTF
jgi:hypothetical protein